MRSIERTIRILLVEDEEADAELALLALQAHGLVFEFERVTDERAFLAALERMPDIVLSDQRLPGFTGERALELINQRGIDIPYIAMSGELSSAEAVRLLRAGARDYVPKHDLTRLGPAVAREIVEAEARRMHRREARLLDQLKLAVESSDDSIAVFDRELRFLYANPAHQCRHGQAAEWFAGRHLREVIGEVQFLRALPHLERALEGDTVRFETEQTFAGAGLVHAGITYSPLRDPAGHVIGVVGVLRDMSEQKRAEAARQAALQRTQMLIEQMPVACVAMDRDGVVTDVNPAYARLFGYTREELVGHRPFENVVDAEHQVIVQAVFDRVLAGEAVNMEEPQPNICKDGRVVQLQWSNVPLRDDAGAVTGILAIAIDLTARKQAEERLVHLAEHDALTNLPNRNALDAALRAAMQAEGEQAGVAALLVVNLDRFKEVNDTLGHGAGDAALIRAASMLRELAPAPASVARLGGDEFAVVVPACGHGRADALAERIIDAFSRPMSADGHEIFITASVGIALAPVHGTEPEPLLRNADLAMYRAKSEHRGGYLFYDARFTARLRNLRQLETDLHRALERDELSLRFQPLLALEDRSVVGAEALLRWTHPELGDVSPARFIPVAEETGLIVPIGEWVLREACRQAVAWQAAGHPQVRIAVNVSAHQLRRGGFADLVASVLADSGLPAHLLELELTESSLMQDTAAASAVLDDLKTLGVQIAMDDFGTGYSSLAYLRRFPIDKLKIDRSFVAELPGDPEAVALAGTIVAMAHGLGMSALAEGIETPEQARFLRDIGCEEGQGWLFAKAMPADELLRLLDSGTVESGGSRRPAALAAAVPA